MRNAILENDLNYCQKWFPLLVVVLLFLVIDYAVIYFYTGSPCDTKVGLDRRTFVFKHAIQILNDGDLSNKVIFLNIVLVYLYLEDILMLCLVSSSPQ